MTNRTCIVSTIKATKREMLEFVSYHLNIGIDHIFLFFDNPKDKNFSLFLVNKQVTSIACTDEHWQKLGFPKPDYIETRQKANANYAINLAQKKHIKWIMHIDIDELVYPEKPLKELLEYTPNDISYIWMRPYEAVPNNIEHSSAFQEINLFKVYSDSKIKHLIDMENKTHLKNILYQGQYFRGHTGGKSLVNLAKSENIKCLGIHRPVFRCKDVKSLEISNLSLLHYDCATFKSWLKKWERRYDGSATFNGRRNRKEQYNEFIKAYLSDSEQKLMMLYQRYYILTNEEKKLLNKHGLIRKTNIPNYLFHDNRT